MITGTNHFVNYTHARRYYRKQNPSMSWQELTECVVSKIIIKEIELGYPELKPGQRLITIDDGARYAIEDKTP